VWFCDIPFMSNRINQGGVFCLNQVSSNHRFLEAFYLHGSRSVVMAILKSSFGHKIKEKGYLPRVLKQQNRLVILTSHEPKEFASCRSYVTLRLQFECLPQRPGCTTANEAHYAARSLLTPSKPLCCMMQFLLATYAGRRFCPI
jgi:hypothetical protein